MITRKPIARKPKLNRTQKSESRIVLCNRNSNILKRRRNESLESLTEKQMENILEDINDTALAVVRYGMENTDICDLMATAAENLDLDWRDKENEQAIEEEMTRLEDNARDAVNAITNAIDSILPLSKLNRAQKQRLCFGLEDLSCYGAKAVDDPIGYARSLCMTIRRMSMICVSLSRTLWKKQNTWNAIIILEFVVFSVTVNVVNQNRIFCTFIHGVIVS